MNTAQTDGTQFSELMVAAQLVHDGATDQLGHGFMGDILALKAQRDELLEALDSLATEFVAVFPIYYFAEPWAHDKNEKLKNARTVIAKAGTHLSQVTQADRTVGNTGHCLWMVCYRTSLDSYQTYWNVYPGEREEDATEQARRDGTLRPGVHHRWTVPYNKAGMTVEQTYADYCAKRGAP